MPDSATAPAGLLLSDDLMFTSRISGTARALGQAVQTVRTTEALLDRARQQAPPCVLLDLAVAGAGVVELVRQLKAEAGPPFVVAYGSHVDAASLHVAREAGCDVVLPRSKFVEELPRALAEWLAGRQAPSS